MNNSRFKLITAAETVEPNTCLVCGGYREHLIDTGISMEYHGAIYLCILCLSEMRAVCPVAKEVEPEVVPTEAFTEKMKEYEYHTAMLHSIVSDLCSSNSVRSFEVVVEDKPAAVGNDSDDDSVVSIKRPNGAKRNTLSVELRSK